MPKELKWDERVIKETNGNGNTWYIPQRKYFLLFWCDEEYFIKPTTYRRAVDLLMYKRRSREVCTM